MNSTAFVQLALDTLQCTQKDLAIRLGVSPTQISKWKKGDHLSPDMETKFRKLTKVGEGDPEFVLSAGSLADAGKWENLIRYLAKFAREGAETGYNTLPLDGDNESLCSETFRVLKQLGITLPSNFPRELDFNYEGDEEDKFGALLETNPYLQIIYEIFCSLNDVYGFYAAYISELIWDEKLDFYETEADNIEAELMGLAASKIRDKHEFTPQFAKFRHAVRKNYIEWLNFVKDRAFRAGIPLKAELLNLVYATNDELGSEAERESLGLNEARLHPDVYMNELLVGMRVIHQVLPAILKKLNIQDEFELNESDLRLN